MDGVVLPATGQCRSYTIFVAHKPCIPTDHCALSQLLQLHRGSCNRRPLNANLDVEIDVESVRPHRTYVYCVSTNLASDVGQNIVQCNLESPLFSRAEGLEPIAH